MILLILLPRNEVFVWKQFFNLSLPACLFIMDKHDKYIIWGHKIVLLLRDITLLNMFTGFLNVCLNLFCPNRLNDQCVSILSLVLFSSIWQLYSLRDTVMFFPCLLSHLPAPCLMFSPCFLILSHHVPFIQVPVLEWKCIELNELNCDFMLLPMLQCPVDSYLHTILCWGFLYTQTLHALENYKEKTFRLLIQRAY